MNILESYELAHQSFCTGAVMTEDNETLLNHLFGLANQNNINEGTQHRDIIRGITINHILLQWHIDGLNRQNTKTQKWVITLAVASLIGTGAQVWFAAKGDKTPEEKMRTTVSQSQKATVQSTVPILAVPLSSGQVIKKAR